MGLTGKHKMNLGFKKAKKRCARALALLYPHARWAGLSPSSPLSTNAYMYLLPVSILALSPFPTPPLRLPHPLLASDTLRVPPPLFFSTRFASNPRPRRIFR